MTRLLLVIVGLCLCLWKFSTAFHAAETIRSEGDVVLFELAPVDPRELFLGDYMRLNYELGTQTEWQRDNGDTPERPVVPDVRSGIAVIRMEDDVARIVRFDDLEDLASDEKLIRFTKPNRWWNGLSIGGDRYYFQSGTGEQYEEAAYGIFRVMPDGRALLSGLADEKKRPIRIAGEAPLSFDEG